ncbi:unnamed protein product [Phaedon cochleariae]|uniref:Zinc finger PHD-type domain-containing protein n=1 Tax=Phaedon cochleariae TaxID=80249 RepID=A0A9N9X4X5_PHACE|nr:unnamed protein product [Phaedon cochleariae]
MATDIDAFFSDTTVRANLKEIFASAFCFQQWDEICLWFNLLAKILNTQTKTPDLHQSLEDLICLCCKNVNYKNEYTYESMPYADIINSETAPLYKCSPFFIFFKELFEDQNYTYDGFSQRNEYFNRDFFTLFLKKYIAYLPMWCGILTCERLSNAPVERWFGIAKNSIARGLMHQKCSRIIGKIREHVIFIHKEQKYKIPKEKCASKSRIYLEREGLLAKETWRKKVKAPHVTNFERLRLKKLLDSSDNKLDVDECIYCKEGALDVTAEWVECDKCCGWVHIRCISGYENMTFSGDFVCEPCLLYHRSTDNRNSEPVKDAQNKLSVLHDYLDKIILDEECIKKIELDTRGQSTSVLWKNERRKRVTASHFGEICKARSTETKIRVAKKIMFPEPNFNKYTRHGKDFEKQAIVEYEELTKKICRQTGLIIHEKHQFIGGSPDGLVNEDGIVEVKCPFSVKNFDVLEACRLGKIPYCDKSGCLKVVSDHYYQIQGLLQVTNRNWCDFVIYTFKGIKVERIHRNDRFWEETILPKLKEFYMFLMLPYESGFCDENSIDFIKWKTSKDIFFLDNGLVEDPRFYKKLDVSYTICSFPEMPCDVREITSSDFEILRETTGENIHNILDNIAGILEVPITKSDVTEIHRVQLNSEAAKKFPKPVIVKLNSTVMQAARTHRRNLTLKNLNFRSEDPVYINEHLSPFFETLLKKSCIFCKDNGFKFCWVATLPRHGQVKHLNTQICLSIDYRPTDEQEFSAAFSDHESRTPHFHWSHCVV